MTTDKILRLSDAGERAPRCPLCLTHLMEKFHDWVKGVSIWACHKYKVAINTADPFVNRWEEALQNSGGKIECPACNAAMRYFATSTGFMKAVCPKKKCGATMSNAEPDRDKKTIVATPEQTGTVQ